MPQNIHWFLNTRGADSTSRRPLGPIPQPSLAQWPFRGSCFSMNYNQIAGLGNKKEDGPAPLDWPVSLRLNSFFHGLFYHFFLLAVHQ